MAPMSQRGATLLRLQVTELCMLYCTAGGQKVSLGTTQFNKLTADLEKKSNKSFKERPMILLQHGFVYNTMNDQLINLLICTRGRGGWGGGACCWTCCKQDCLCLKRHNEYYMSTEN